MTAALRAAREAPQAPVATRLVVFQEPGAGPQARAAAAPLAARRG